jgi:pimeloyl-ACP methyl ester carboxylesterase
VFFSWIDQPFFDPASREQYRRCFSEAAIVRHLRGLARWGNLRFRTLTRLTEREVAASRALWGSRGLVSRLYDVLEIWRAWANDVQAQPIEGGHFLPEQAPEETLKALGAFLRDCDARCASASPPPASPSSQNPASPRSRSFGGRTVRMLG